MSTQVLRRSSSRLRRPMCGRFSTSRSRFIQFSSGLCPHVRDLGHSPKVVAQLFRTGIATSAVEFDESYGIVCSYFSVRREFKQPNPLFFCVMSMLHSRTYNL